MGKYDLKVEQLRKMIPPDTNQIHVVYRDESGGCSYFTIDKDQELTPEQKEIMGKPGRSFSFNRGL